MVASVPSNPLTYNPAACPDMKMFNLDQYTIPGGPLEPGEPPPGPKTAAEVDLCLKDDAERLKECEKLLPVKLRAVITIHGVPDTAKLLGVHPDTIYSWTQGEHVPRDIRRIDTVLSWACRAPNVWERALYCFYSECMRESDERCREDILRAFTLNVALAIRQYGFSYEFKCRPQNRASLYFSGPNLPPTRVITTISKANKPCVRVFLAQGSVAMLPPPIGVLVLVQELQNAQRENARRASRRPIEEIDEAINNA